MNDRSELEILMGEMAALVSHNSVSDDSIREDIECKIVDQPWAQVQWQQLLQENECYRSELKKVEVPNDLESRVLQLSQRPVKTNSRTFSWAWALAIVLLIGVGVALFFLNNQTNARLQSVALLAIDNHLNHIDDHGVEPDSRKREELAAALSKQVQFEVFLPQISDRLKLIGGRKCKLGTHTVAFSLWRDVNNNNYSLFQFQPSNFGLSTTTKPQLIKTKDPAGEKHPCGAWVWTDRSVGYVLVGDPDCNIESLKPEKFSPVNGE